MPRKRELLNAKTKARSVSRSNTQRKKPLDELLSKTPQSLVKGYSSKELQELYMRVASLEQEIGQFVDQTPQVASVLSVKKDNGVLWFYVQWDSEAKSFIPARILNKIAPEKVIEFYEGLLTFQPDKEKKPLDLDKLQEQSTDMQVDSSQKKQPMSPEAEVKPETPTSLSRESKPEQKHGAEQAPQPKDEERKPRKQLYTKHQQQQHQHSFQQQLLQQQLPKNYHTMNCTGCQILLQYPDGTTAKIKCPACHAIMQAL